MAIADAVAIDCKFREGLSAAVRARDAGSYPDEQFVAEIKSLRARFAENVKMVQIQRLQAIQHLGAMDTRLAAEKLHAAGHQMAQLFMSP